MQTCPGAIVLVSDTLEIRAALQQIFRGSGWQMGEARAVSELAQLFSPSTPTVVLTDECLPDGGWLDVLALAGALCPHAPVLVTAKSSSDTFWAEVLNRGGFDVLAQPLDSIEVLRVAASALLSSRSRVRRATA